MEIIKHDMVEWTWNEVGLINQRWCTWSFAKKPSAFFIYPKCDDYSIICDTAYFTLLSNDEKKIKFSCESDISLFFENCKNKRVMVECLNLK